MPPPLSRSPSARPAPPAVRAMPWVVAIGSGLTYLVTHSEAHSYVAFRYAFSAWQSPSAGQCLSLPGNLLYTHLLWLLALPIRLAGRAPDTVLIAQILGALSVALAVGLFYARTRALVVDWETSLLGALLFASSFAVWHSAVEVAPQGPALALGMGALMLAWPARRSAGLGRLALAGLCAAGAALLDLGALPWLIPLGVVAAWGRRRGEAAGRVAAVACPAALVLVLAYWLAWRAVKGAGQMQDFSQWLAFLGPRQPEASGLYRVFLYFKTFKFALLYRAPWFIGLPVAAGFAGLPRAWRQNRAAVLVFGLWAAGGIVRSLPVDPAEIQVWALAMPGVMGLLVCSLDAGLAVPALRRVRPAAMLLGALTFFLFMGYTRGWLPRFERLAGYAESKQAAQRLAELSPSPQDLFLVPSGYFNFLLPYCHGRRWILDPAAIRRGAAGESPDPASWLAATVDRARQAGRSVFVHVDYLNPQSSLYASKALPSNVAEALAASLPGPGEAPKGFPLPFAFRSWRAGPRRGGVQPSASTGAPIPALRACLKSFGERPCAGEKPPTAADFSPLRKEFSDTL